MNKKEYFIEYKGIKEGAFNLEELKQKNIYDTTLVWKAGWENWKRATEVEELIENIIAQPPLSPNEIARKTKKQTSKQTLDYIKSTFPMFIITGIVTSLILNYLSYLVAKDGGTLQYPIYLTREERADPMLIFWDMLPTSLVIGFVLALIVFAIMWYRTELQEKIIVDKYDSLNSILLSIIGVLSIVIFIACLIIAVF